MLKRIGLVFGMVALTLSIAGCNGDKGDGFIGRWNSGGQKKEAVAVSPPVYVVNIAKDGDLFHIDVEVESHDFLNGGRKTTTKKLEGKAESDTVLSMSGGIRTMRLQDGRMFFDGHEYEKVN